jgi:predicted PurR-regulated permease PerM
MEPLRQEKRMKQESKTLLYIVVGALICGLIYLLAPMLTPFLFGAFLAYLADPLVVKVQARGLPRVTSAVIVFFSLFVTLVILILLLIPLVQSQAANLPDMVPNTLNWVQNNILPWLKSHVGLDEGTINVDTLKSMVTDNLSQAGGAANSLLKTVLHSGVKIAEYAINLILIPVVMFYLLCDWNKVINGIHNLIPRKIEPRVVKLARESDEVLSAFFRGQLIVILVLSILYSVGLSLIGLQIGIIIGVMAGIVSIVPYLGFILGIIIASIAAAVQFGTFSSVLFVWLVFGSIHLFENMFLTPKLVGDRIGLHPVAVIFAILAGGTLFGFLGVLLALPVASVIMVWVRYLHRRYRRSKLFVSEA